ncbi:MAG: hypothetical protein KF898_03205 [Parachlamydiales bacterium]|nr:hypothetical protein [Verrucomicrobiota bacterium]MBX3718641.1 hypothetical protein [Candidatus Acheromyda pituitae]
MSAPVTDPAASDYSNWELACSQTSYEYNTKLALQVQHLQYLLAVMGTVPTETAYHMISGVELVDSNIQGTEQVGIPASSLNAQNAALSLVSLTQSLFNDLIAGAPGYEAYVYNQNGSMNPNYQPMANPDTPDQAQEYVNEYNEFNECLDDLNSMFSAALDPNSPEYGWCDANTANTMIASIDSIQTAMDNLTTYNSSTDHYDYYDNQPEGGNNSSSCYYFAQHCMQYEEDPSTSPYSADFNDITMSLNTMQATMNQVSSMTTGQIKAGASEVQQILSSTKSSGKAEQEQTKYWVEHQISN